MSKAYIIYGLFMVAGLVFLGWQVKKMDRAGEGQDGLPKRPEARYEKPKDEDLPFPYDLSGRVPALEGHLQLAKAPNLPLFWIKGNLQVVIAENWSGDFPLRYQRYTMDRDALHRLMREIEALPHLEKSQAGRVLRSYRRSRDGEPPEPVVLDAAAVEKVLRRELDGKTPRSARPPALRLRFRTDVNAQTWRPWPFHALRLDRLIEAKEHVVTDPETIDRLLARPRPVDFFEKDEHRAYVTTEVLTKRP